MLIMSVDRMLRKIFRFLREEVTGGWRKAHNAETRDFYRLQNVICVCVVKSRRLSWTGLVAYVEYKRNMYRVLLTKAEGQSPVGITVLVCMRNNK